MKVAYNNCFGGFSLSSLAKNEFAKKKGFTLTWYEQIGYKHNGDRKYKRLEGVPKSNGFSIYALTKDCGEEIKELPSNDFYYIDFYEDEIRCDTDLIEVIEKFGDKENGECASLAIAEVPEGASFEITEYDGNEDVVPPRMSW